MFCASLHRKHEKRQDFFLEIHFDSVTDAKKWVRKNSDRLYYLAIGTFE